MTSSRVVALLVAAAALSSVAYGQTPIATANIPLRCAPAQMVLSKDAAARQEFSLEPKVSADPAAVHCQARAALTKHLVVSLEGGTAGQFSTLLGISLPEFHAAEVRRVVVHKLDNKHRDPAEIAKFAGKSGQAQITPQMLDRNLGMGKTYLAAYLGRSGQLHIYQGISSSAAPSQRVAKQRFEEWKATYKVPPAARPPDPPSIIAESYMPLLAMTLTWTDSNGGWFELDGLVARANGNFLQLDYYALATQFTWNPTAAETGKTPEFINPDFPQYGVCDWVTQKDVLSQGVGWCGPFLDDWTVAYATPQVVQGNSFLAPPQILETDPPSSQESCGSSFTMGSSVSESISASSASHGSVSAGGTYGIQEANGINCNGPDILVYNNSSSSQMQWAGTAGRAWWADLGGGALTPPPDQTALAYASQGAILAVDDRVTALSNAGFAVTVGTELDNVNIGAFTQYLATTTVAVSFNVVPPIFQVSPTQLQVCGAPATATTSVVAWNQGSTAPGATLTQGSQYVNPWGSWPSTGTSNLPSPDLPYAALGWAAGGSTAPGASPYVNKWIQFPDADKEGQAISPTATPTDPDHGPQFHVGVANDFPLNDTTAGNFWIYTTVPNAAPSEDNGDNVYGFAMNITAWGQPTIIDVPTTSSPGSPITITGTGFKQDSTVIFGSQGSQKASSVSSDGTSLTVVPPAGNGTVAVQVQTDCGTSAPYQPSPEIVASGGRQGIRLLHNDLYTFWPNVSGVSPSGGPLGSTVTIKGNGFNGATSTSFGAYAGRILAVDPQGSWVKAQLPSAADLRCAGGFRYEMAPVDVAVTTPVGTSPNTVGDVFKIETLRCQTPPVRSCVASACRYPDVAGNVSLTETLDRLRGRYAGITRLIVGPAEPPHQFCARCSVTRMQFAQTMQRILNLGAARQRIAFRDVAPGTPAAGAAQATAPFLGVQVTPTGLLFRPDNSITRADAAAAVVRVLISSGRMQLMDRAAVQSELRSVPDARAIAPADVPYLAAALHAGLLRRKAGEALDARAPLDRETLVGLMNRASIAATAK